MRVAQAVVAAGLLAALALPVRFHAALIVCPYQMEYREGAMPVLTGALLRGVNPFDSIHHPELSTQYGILYNIIVLPLAASGGSTFLVHRLVTGVAIIGACLILLLICRAMRISWMLSASIAAVWYVQLLRFVTPLARPDGVGLLLFMASLFSVWRTSFSFRGLLLCGAFGILAFLTKAYFLLAPVLVAGYVWFFVSKRRGAAFLAGFACAMTAMALVVHRLFPGYWREILLNIEVNFKWGRLGWQSLWYGRSLLELVLTLPLIAGIRWVASRRADRTDQKAFQPGPGLFLFSGLGVAVALCRMGGNQGAWMTYYFQLLSPFVLISYAWLVVTSCGRWTWLVAPFLILNLYRVSVKDLPRYDMPQYRQAWERASELIASHRHVLNTTAAVTGLLVDQHRPVDNTGLSEFFSGGLNKNSFLKVLLWPTDAQVREIVARRADWIRVGIRARRWDLVVSDERKDEWLERFYRPAERLRVLMPAIGQSPPLVFWVPQSRRRGFAGPEGSGIIGSGD